MIAAVYAHVTPRKERERFGGVLALTRKEDRSWTIE